MKAQLTRLLTSMAAHHVEKARAHRARAEEHRGLSQHFGKLAQMSKAMDGESDHAASYTAMSKHHADLAESDNNDAENHIAAGEACTECAKAFSAHGKAAGMGDDDLDAIAPLPEGLTIHGNVPHNLRAVPRAGSAPLPMASENPLFGKIFGDLE